MNNPLDISEAAILALEIEGAVRRPVEIELAATILAAIFTVEREVPKNIPVDIISDAMLPLEIEPVDM